MASDPETKGIHKYVARYLRGLGRMDGLRVVDVPAGAGRTCKILHEAGAEVVALDLFPEMLQVDGLEGTFADLSEPLPVEDGWADLVICQEGIEHLSDQLSALEEFNRILKPGGRLLITTPNLSNLRSRVSWFLMESDMWRRMPPSEVDSIWFSEGASDRLYFGHLFLLGVHRLQSLLRIAGFRSEERLRTKTSITSVWMTVVAWPVLWLTTTLAQLRYPRKNRHISPELVTPVFQEHRDLNLSFTTNACKSIFWVQRKAMEVPEARARLKDLTRSGQGEH
tara:strand:- start:7840 stop:8682 length:843 start_codon:yes stop_codon:yes gene_type:complete